MFVFIQISKQKLNFQILQTLPFDKVNIKLISIHLSHHDENIEKFDRIEYMQNITNFLLHKSFKLIKEFDMNYIFQFVNRTNKAV